MDVVRVVWFILGLVCLVAILFFGDEITGIGNNFVLIVSVVGCFYLSLFAGR